MMRIDQGQSLTPAKPLSGEWRIVLLSQYTKWTKSNSLVHFFARGEFVSFDMTSAQEFLRGVSCATPS